MTDRRLATRLGLMSVASLLIALLDAVGLLLLVPLVDGLADADADATVPLLGTISVGGLISLVVGLFVAKTVAAALVRWWASGVVANANAEAATALFGAYMDAPLEFHDRRNSSQMVQVVQGTVNQVFQRGVLGVTTVLIEGTTLAVLALVVLFASPLASLASVVYFGVASLVYLRLVQAKVRDRARRAEVSNAAAVRTVQEGLGGLREHRVRGSELLLVDRYERDRRAGALGLRVVAFMSELSRYYLELLFVGGFGVVAAVTLSFGTEESTLAGLALLLGAGFRVLPSISRLLGAMTGIRAGLGSLTVVLDDLDALGIDRLRIGPTLSVQRVEATADTHVGICVSGVSFTYPGGEPLLRDLSFAVPPGTSLGVVGPSGAGKSTIVDLIVGVRVPSEGTVDFGRRGRPGIGLVPQDVFLLDADVSSNVAFGLPVEADRVEKALERAQLLQFVQGLPAGFETVVGERGTRLSGGQRQRLGIARALYASPAVLVLDEATAALDVETEAAVVDAVEALSGELTVVVVAHRLSTIRRCDQVAYIENGSVLAIGSFDEVAQCVPAFARAVELAGLGSGDGSA